MATAALRPAQVVPVRLGEVAGLLPAPGPDLRAAEADILVSGVTHDSRQVLPGDLYAALPGARVQGADFAAEAVAAGAVAVLTETPVGAGVPELVVTDARAVLGPVASLVYGEPSRHLALYAVTGTNGKTTTAYLLEAGLRAAGHRTGLIGTIETRVGDDVLPSVRTTPEATDLQAVLAVMVERGVTACAMEVSSHALALGRVAGCWFVAAIFTNLSQDHLDFHASMQDYYAAKASLFTPGYSCLAVIDVTDPHGARLASEVRGLRVAEVGSDIHAPCGLIGSFNTRNAAVALEALVETGVDPEAAARGIAGLQSVPGRMERIEAGQSYLALVDYAHTPEAVVSLLGALRPLTSRELVIVLGCGGDRDRAKRPLMGAAAARGADRAIFTDDNPRSERSADILAAMLAGVPPDRAAQVTVEPDRRAAIALAIRDAGPGDTVVVAGKGHETGQETAGVVVPFDDRTVVRDLIEAAAAARAHAGGSRA